MHSRMSRFVLAGVAVFAVPGNWGQVAEHPVLLALSKIDHLAKLWIIFQTPPPLRLAQ
jgi:predicted Rossmann-fold nucleotide-binding protein